MAASKQAASLLVGDVLPGVFGGVVTGIQAPRRGERYVQVWTDDKFVPKCYEPTDTVEVLAAPEQKSEAQR